MSNGIAHHLLPRNRVTSIVGLTGKYYYHEIASWGDFKGLHFVVYVASRLGQALCPERAESPAARVIKTNPTTPVVDLMVEKIPFSAPFAADVTQRWIRALARYREPHHCRSIFEIAVTLMPFAALWALAMAAAHSGCSSRLLWQRPQ